MADSSRSAHSGPIFLLMEFLGELFVEFLCALPEIFLH